MSRAKAKLCLIILLAEAASAPASAEVVRLRLEEVLDAAVAKAKVEDARLDLARSTLQFLDTQNRLRIELRPNLNLFAFSNPVLLATNIGSGLLFNRRTAPGFAAMDGARFDILASEVNAETLKVRVRLEAARAYFDVLEHQQTAKLAADMLRARKAGGTAVHSLLQAARITAADQLSYEQELLELESQWLNAESERKSAAARLAVLIGRTDAPNDLAVDDVAPSAGDHAIPALENLLQLALTRRGESRLLRDKVAALRGATPGPKRASIDNVNAGYSYVSNKAGVANALNGSILGGHTGLGNVTLSIPLRDVGERAAHDRVTAARIRLLELEISAMEESVRREVSALQDAANSSAERERLALRKLELAKRAAGVVRARAETGLAPLHATWTADAAVLSAESAYTRAVYEHKAALYALRVVCGTDRINAVPGELTSAAE